MHARHPSGQAGFTLIEVLVAVALTAILFTLAAVNLGRPQVNADVASATNTLVSDIKSQQLLAMSGNQGSTTGGQPQGVYVQASQYILFAGNAYSSADTNNFAVSPGSNIALATTLPSGQVIFSKGTGEVQGFTSGSNTITITGNGLAKTITINRLGALTVN